MLKQRSLWMGALILSIVLSIQFVLKGFALLTTRSLESSNRIDFWMGLEFFALGILYLIWLYQIRADKTVLKFTRILKSATPFLVLSWLAYPTTHDIYLYLQYGLMSLNRINPYWVKSGEFQSSLNLLLDWNVTSTYGVVSTFFFVISAKLAEINLAFGIYGFKLICLAFHILNAYLIWKILRQDSRQGRVTFAYLLSPILLFEQVVEAHLDVFLCTILIAIDQFLKHRKYLSALVMTGVGFLTKTLPIIWLPLIGVFLIRQKRWKVLALFSLICAIAIFGLSLTLFPSIEAWKSILNPGVRDITSGSWHNLLGGLLERTRGAVPIEVQALVSNVFRKMMMLFFAGYYAVTLFKICRKSALLEGQLMVKIGWVTLVLFAFATPWYQPWYATILLPIAALNLEARFFVMTSFVFSWVGTIAHFCLSYNQTRLGMLGSLLTMGSVIVMLLMRSKLTQESLPLSASSVKELTANRN
jgi:alpha-1,6-mannosyltransferase